MKNYGNKVSGLEELNELFPGHVPQFKAFVLDEIFSNWKIIKARLLKLDFKNLSLLDQLQINTQIWSDLSVWQGSKVSFRTSAISEDNKHNSFAGQYESFLDIELSSQTFEQYTRLCTKSLFSPRVLGYAKKHNLNFVPDGAVIIQQMFYGDYTGVAFSENGQFAIQVAYNQGWKNKVVDGDNANYVTLDKLNQSQWSEKLKCLPSHSLQIVQAILFLEKQKRYGVDVEWAVNSNDWQLLQCRPITSFQTSFHLDFENTNLAESYPGITSPLTFSLVRKLYARVYREFMLLLGAKEEKLDGLDFNFNHMIGTVNGRLYYNMHNWYQLIALLPVFEQNKKFFELMLKPAKSKKGKQKKQHKSISQSENKLLSLVTLVKFIFYLLSTDRYGKKFIKQYKKLITVYQDIVWEQLTAEKTLEIFEEMKNNLLKQWAIPILNDFRLMVFHGLLVSKFFPPAKNNEYINFLSQIYDQTSLEPIKALQLLLPEIFKIKLEYQNDQKAVRAIIKDKKYSLVLAEIKNYLDVYGGRTPNELKFESPRLEENLSDFILFLVKNAVNYQVVLTNKKNSEISANSKRSLLFKFLLWQTKLGISKRERFRFYRAQVYGIVRKIYLSLGKKMQSVHILDEVDDIFYLTDSEIELFTMGSLIDHSLKEVAVNRKKLYRQYEDKNLGRRIIGDNLWPISDFSNDEEDESNTNQKETILRGIGTSPGIITAEAVVVKDFHQAPDLSGKILITEMTDPGWTLLFLSTSGVVVERGNALSHAAIISRELGIPCVVGIKDIYNKIKTGDILEINGHQGTIKKL